MSVISQVFHKNEGNSRAICRVFREELSNLSHFYPFVNHHYSRAKDSKNNKKCLVYWPCAVIFSLSFIITWL